MENVAKKFEQEEGILEEVQQQIKCGGDFYSLPNLFPFIDEDGWHVNFTSAKLVSTKGTEEISGSGYESSLLSPLYDQSLSTHQGISHGSQVMPIGDHYSDDSDSEIFRVKRRSSVKAEKKTANNVMISKFSEQQVNMRSTSFFYLLFLMVNICSCLLLV